MDKSRLSQKQQPENELSVRISSVVLVLILIVLLILVLILILIVLLVLVVLLILILVVHFNLSRGINLTLKPTALRLFTRSEAFMRQSSIYLDSTSSVTAPII